MRVTAIITAAGLSKRMGAQNKLLLPHGDGTLLGHVIETVKTACATFPGMAPPLVVLGHEREKVAEAIAEHAVAMIMNEDYETGMTSSIQAAVRHVAGSAYLICLGDLPELKSEDVVAVIEAYKERHDPKAIIVPEYEGRRGHPVLIGAAWRGDILALPEGDGCKALIKARSEHVRLLKRAGKGGIVDLDTPSDLNLLGSARLPARH